MFEFCEWLFDVLCEFWEVEAHVKVSEDDDEKCQSYEESSFVVEFIKINELCCFYMMEVFDDFLMECLDDLVVFSDVVCCCPEFFLKCGCCLFCSEEGVFLCFFVANPEDIKKCWNESEAPVKVEKQGKKGCSEEDEGAIVEQKYKV